MQTNRISSLQENYKMIMIFYVKCKNDTCLHFLNCSGETKNLKSLEKIKGKKAIK
jgi:hypothetical protein